MGAIQIVSKEDNTMIVRSIGRCMNNNHVHPPIKSIFRLRLLISMSCREKTCRYSSKFDNICTSVW
jgi:hypothetical protein